MCADNGKKDKRRWARSYHEPNRTEQYPSYHMGYYQGFETGFEKGYAEGSILGYNNGFLDALKFDEEVGADKPVSADLFHERFFRIIRGLLESSQINVILSGSARREAETLFKLVGLSVSLIEDGKDE